MIESVSDWICSERELESHISMIFEEAKIQDFLQFSIQFMTKREIQHRDVSLLSSSKKKHSDSTDIRNFSLSRIWIFLLLSIQFRTKRKKNTRSRDIRISRHQEFESFYHYRSSSSKIERTLFTSDSSRKYHRELSHSSSKLDTRLFSSYSSEEYRRKSSMNEEQSRYRFSQEKSRLRTKSNDYYRSYRSDQKESRLRSKQKSRYLEENRRTERYKEKYRQELVTARSIYDFDSRSLRKDFILARFSQNKLLNRRSSQIFVFSSRSSWYDLIFASSFWKDLIFASSSWKDLIFTSSSWKDFISAHSEYDYDSRYCIRLLYLSENDLNENDLDENDYDLLWFSHLEKTSLFWRILTEIFSFQIFFHLHHSFSWRAGFFRSKELLWDRSFSERIRIDQNRSHLHIFTR